MTNAELSLHHRFVAGRDNSAPTLLLLHGTGGSENDLIDLGSGLLPGASLLSPRGAVEENGMARFFRRIAEGVFDLDDLRRRAADLAAFVTSAADVYGFDRHRVVAVGYSNGANIAASLLLLHPGVLSGAVLFRAMVPIVPEKLPELSRVPVFMASGSKDPLISEEQADALADLLRRSGAAVTLRWQEAGHGLAMDEVQAAATWLASTVRAGRAEPRS